MSALIQQPPDAAPSSSGPVTRKYQEEMLQESLQRNIIIVLDTVRRPFTHEPTH